MASSTLTIRLKDRAHALLRGLAAKDKQLGSLYRKRVPVLLQLSALECGAACLAMVLSFYGRKTRVAEIREQCGVGRDGLTAHTIMQTAQQYGLRTKAYAIEPELLPQMTLPAIAHWQFNHFVVVEKWSPTHVDIVDPAAGRRRLSSEQFSKGFTGVLLTMEPSVHFDSRQSNRTSTWRRYSSYLLLSAGIPKLLLQIVAASLILQLFSLLIPVITKIVVDEVLPFQQDDILRFIGIGIGVLLLAQLSTSYLRTSLLIYLQARLDTQMMLGFFEHVLALPYRFFQQRSTGDLLMRLNSNTVIREVLTSQTISLLLDSTFIFVYLLLIFSQSAQFGLIVLILGLLQVLLLIGTHRPVQRLVQKQLAEISKSQGYLVETLSGIETLKAAGAEGLAFDKWTNLFYKQVNATIRQNYVTAVVEIIISNIRTFSPLLLLWIGARLVLTDQMSLGTMLALTALATAFLVPLGSLVSSSRQLQTVSAHLERITDVLEAEPEQATADVRTAPPLTGQIALENITFRYHKNAPDTLTNISLTIKSGQKIAIVGQTGSGKSTLAKILTGLYTPTAGAVYYDDVPLTAYAYQSVRRQMGIVLQESFLFNTSIRQNIAFHRPEMTLDEAVHAAQLAAIHSDIMQMPMGYETVVSEGGNALSGGQRQRLSLARALASQPNILILDEATSQLDVTTEAKVDCNLSQLNCTRIVIAHRLSTIRNADLILVLDRGAVVEQGTHHELFAQKGAYYRLVSSQLAEQEN